MAIAPCELVLIKTIIIFERTQLNPGISLLSGAIYSLCNFLNLSLNTRKHVQQLARDKSFEIQIIAMTPQRCLNMTFSWFSVTIEDKT